MHNNMNINDKPFSEWSVFDLYNLDETVTYFTNLAGQRTAYCTATLQLPKIISGIWTTAIVAEKPMVEIAQIGQLYEVGKIYNQIKKAVELQFAYGRVAIVPKLNEVGKGSRCFFEIISDADCNNLKYFNENGLTKYLEYTRAEKMYDENTQEIETVLVTEKHFYDGVNYKYQKISRDDKKIIEEVEKAQSSEMNNFRYILPQVFELQTLKQTGRPIWLDAYKSINDCNLAYSELLREMKLARRVVGVPMHISAEAGARQKEAQKKDKQAFDPDLMMFTLLPGLPADAQTWQKFGGDFTPAPYLELLKFLLNQVSLLVGFGTNKLSEDKQGGAKTAREVSAEANTMLLNAEMIKTLFHDVIKYFVQIREYMENDKVINPDTIYVTNSDSVFNDNISLVEQMYKDVVSGLIPPSYYRKRIYTEDAEELEEIMSPLETNPTEEQATVPEMEENVEDEEQSEVNE